MPVSCTLCHYYGTAHLDFARYLVERGARFELPAWTNTVPVSLVQPELRSRADEHKLDEARLLAQLYVDLGCHPGGHARLTSLPGGPVLGDQIVGSESNAVAYFNSVVGARTNKYGDFLDVCAGRVQRVPFAGLHTDAGRCGEMVFDLADLGESLRGSEMFCHAGPAGFILLDEDVNIAIGAMVADRPYATAIPVLASFESFLVSGEHCRARSKSLRSVWARSS